MLPRGGWFGDLQWLSAFHSDAARLVAIALVVVGAVMISCVPKIAALWFADQKDQRDCKLRKAELDLAVDERLRLEKNKERGPDA